MEIAIGFIYGFNVGFEFNPDRKSAEEAYLIIDLGIFRLMIF